MTIDLQEIERLAEIEADYATQCPTDCMPETWKDVFWMIAELRLAWQKLSVAREALEYYSNEKRYQGQDIVDGIETLEICGDNGDTAIEALAKLDEEGGG